MSETKGVTRDYITHGEVVAKREDLADLAQIVLLYNAHYLTSSHDTGASNTFVAAGIKARLGEIFAKNVHWQDDQTGCVVGVFTRAASTIEENRHLEQVDIRQLERIAEFKHQH